jgi:hypothetical protein
MNRLHHRGSRALARVAKPDPRGSSTVIASFAPAFGRPARMKRAVCGAAERGRPQGSPLQIST